MENMASPTKVENQPVGQPEIVIPNNSSPSKSKLPIFILGVVILILFTLGGVFIGKNLNTPKNFTPTPTIAPKESATPSSISDPTANWTLLRNTEYGYEIKYPNNLKTQVLAAGSENKEADNTTRSFYLFDPKVGMNDLNRYASFEVFQTKPINTEFETENITFNGLLAVRAITPNTVILEIFYVELPNNKGFLEIYASKNSEIKQIVDQILSTFKFTDQTTDWKIYTNQTLGFSFKYPSTFNLNTLKFESINLKGDVNSYIKEKYLCKDVNCPEIKISNIETEKFDKITIYKFEISGVDVVVNRIITDGNKTIEGTLGLMTFPDKKAVNVAVTTLDQILSTFKFAN